MIKGQEHTLSLLSRLSPFDALTIVLNESKNLIVRIPAHSVKPCGLYTIEPQNNKPRMQNSHLYGYLFSEFSESYRKNPLVWVGRELNKKYKNSVNRFSVNLKKIHLCESNEI